MRNAHLEVLVEAITADTCFDRILDFARYPELCDAVRAVTVHPAGPDGAETSDWQVYFRNGVLRWSEVDYPDRSSWRVGFEQTEGDFAAFTGSWTLKPRPDGCVVIFDTDFDFGIPSLAGILDPIAERVFKETIARVLAGLFGRIEVLGDPIVGQALARHLEPAVGAVTGVA
jgi:ribosome-associated toxin RatA of RatAB toxin-antitoxin module